MPDFFVVGHAKCGTTALYEALKRHPEIFLPDLKEPYFFIPEVRREERWTLFGAPRTLEEYLALFAPPQRISASGRSRRITSGQTPPRQASPRRSPMPASSRSCASRRVFCARCTFTYSNPTSRPRRACAGPLPWRIPGARAGRSPAPPAGRACSSTPSTCDTRPSCGASTTSSRPSEFWFSSTRTFVATTARPWLPCSVFWRWTRTRRWRYRSRTQPRNRCADLASTAPCTGSRWDTAGAAAPCGTRSRRSPPGPAPAHAGVDAAPFGDGGA